MGYDVFISHSSRDKTVADSITDRLESTGIRCWIAPRNIPAGQNWGESIVDAMNECKVMVLIFSGTSNVSPQVLREVERAVNKGLHIIPFRIEAASLSKAMEFYISAPQWLDALDAPLEKHLNHLVELVRNIVTGQGTMALEMHDRASEVLPAGRSRLRRAGLIATLAAVLIGVIAMSTMRSWPWFAPPRATWAPLSVKEKIDIAARTNATYVFTAPSGKFPGRFHGRWICKGKSAGITGAHDDSLVKFKLIGPDSETIETLDHPSLEDFDVTIENAGSYTFEFFNTGIIRSSARIVELEGTYQP
jgi:hypothetical protein